MFMTSRCNRIDLISNRLVQSFDLVGFMDMVVGSCTKSVRIQFNGNSSRSIVGKLIIILSCTTIDADDKIIGDLIRSTNGHIPKIEISNLRHRMCMSRFPFLGVIFPGIQSRVGLLLSSLERFHVRMKIGEGSPITHSDVTSDCIGIYNLVRLFDFQVR